MPTESGHIAEGGKQRLVRNALHNSGAWVVTAAVTMLATPYMVFALGAAGYGVYVLLTSLVGYYALFDLALGQGVVKFVAQYNALQDEQGVAQSLNAGLSYQLVAGLIGSCLLAWGADPVLRFLNVPVGLLSPARTSLYLCCAGFFVSMIGGTLNAVLLGLQRYDISSKVNAAASFVSITTTVLVLLAGGGLIGAVAVTVAASFATCLVFYYNVRRMLRSWKFTPTFRGRFARSVTEFSSFLFLSRVSDVANNYVGRFLIGYLLGPVAVTIYSVPVKLVNAVWGLLGSGFSVLFPFASEMGESHNAQLRVSVFGKASRLFAAVMLPALATLFAFSFPVLRIWMGPEFAREAWPVLSILAFASMLASLTTIPIQLVLGWGHSRIVGLFSVFSFVLYLTALWTLSPAWGVIGAAAAMIAGSVPGLVLIPYLLGRVVRIPARRYFRETYLYHLIGLAIAGCLWFFRDFVSNLSVIPLVLVIAAFAGLYLSVLAGTGAFSMFGIARQAEPFVRPNNATSHQ